MADPIKTSKEILEARERAMREAVPAVVDPVQDLRRSVFTFFSERLSRIQKKESLLEKVQKALEEQVEGGELTFDQLKSLFSSVSKEQSFASEGIISLFRPVPGTPSIFANNIGGSEPNDPFSDTFNALSPEKLRKIDALFRFLETAGIDVEEGNNLKHASEPDAEIVEGD